MTHSFEFSGSIWIPAKKVSVYGKLGPINKVQEYKTSCPVEIEYLSKMPSVVWVTKPEVEVTTEVVETVEESQVEEIPSEEEKVRKPRKIRLSEE